MPSRVETVRRMVDLSVLINGHRLILEDARRNCQSYENRYAAWVAQLSAHAIALPADVWVFPELASHAAFGVGLPLPSFEQLDDTWAANYDALTDLFTGGRPAAMFDTPAALREAKMARIRCLTAVLRARMCLLEIELDALDRELAVATVSLYRKLQAMFVGGPGNAAYLTDAELRIISNVHFDDVPIEQLVALYGITEEELAEEE